MQDIKEIEKELSRLNDEHIVLRNKVNELLKEKWDIQKEKLKVLVGKCFLDTEKNKVFIVTSVPKPQYFKSCEAFNPYQIPVYTFFLTEDYEFSRDTHEFYHDTIYTHCCEADDVYEAFVNEGFKEISIDEFKEYVNNIICNVIDSAWENVE